MLASSLVPLIRIELSCTEILHLKKMHSKPILGVLGNFHMPSVNRDTFSHRLGKINFDLSHLRLEEFSPNLTYQTHMTK